MKGAPARGGLRPALLSGLVFPGLGQLAKGHRWRALAFGGGSLLLLLVLVKRLASEVLMRLPEDPEARLEALLDPTLPLRMAAEIERANASLFAWASFALLTLWLGSVLDAWLARRAPPTAAPPPRAG